MHPFESFQTTLTTIAINHVPATSARSGPGAAPSAGRRRPAPAASRRLRKSAGWGCVGWISFGGESNGWVVPLPTYSDKCSPNSFNPPAPHAHVERLVVGAVAHHGLDLPAGAEEGAAPRRLPARPARHAYSCMCVREMRSYTHVFLYNGRWIDRSVRSIRALTVLPVRVRLAVLAAGDTTARLLLLLLLCRRRRRRREPAPPRRRGPWLLGQCPCPPRRA